EDLVRVGDRDLPALDLQQLLARRHAAEHRSTAAEDLLELRGRGFLELVVAALRWRLVRPPALEGGRVPEAVALQVIVGHLADALDAERLPGEVLAPVPARRAAGHPLIAVPLGPFAPGLALGGPFAQRRKLSGQLP